MKILIAELENQIKKLKLIKKKFKEFNGKEVVYLNELERKKYPNFPTIYITDYLKYSLLTTVEAFETIKQTKIYEIYEEGKEVKYSKNNTIKLEGDLYIKIKDGFYLFERVSNALNHLTNPKIYFKDKESAIIIRGDNFVYILVPFIPIGNILDKIENLIKLSKEKKIQVLKTKEAKNLNEVLKYLKDNSPTIFNLKKYSLIVEDITPKKPLIETTKLWVEIDKVRKEKANPLKIEIELEKEFNNTIVFWAYDKMGKDQFYIQLVNYYKDLSDFFEKGDTEIWYAISHFWHNWEIDIKKLKLYDFPKTLENLLSTHIKIGTISLKKIEEIYIKLQADYWSPSGEANKLIRKLGLQHTSISVGDIIIFPKENKGYVVAGIGFKEFNIDMKEIQLNRDERLIKENLLLREQDFPNVYIKKMDFKEELLEHLLEYRDPEDKIEFEWIIDYRDSWGDNISKKEEILGFDRADALKYFRQSALKEKLIFNIKFKKYSGWYSIKYEKWKGV